MASFWQTQDKVDRSVIQKFTDGCESKNCIISARRTGSWTLAGASDHYNHDGCLEVKDPNNGEVDLFCMRCNKSETVNT